MQTIDIYNYTTQPSQLQKTILQDKQEAFKDLVRSDAENLWIREKIQSYICPLTYETHKTEQDLALVQRAADGQIYNAVALRQHIEDHNSLLDSTRPVNTLSDTPLALTAIEYAAMLNKVWVVKILAECLPYETLLTTMDQLCAAAIIFEQYEIADLAYPYSYEGENLSLLAQKYILYKTDRALTRVYVNNVSAEGIDTLKTLAKLEKYLKECNLICCLEKYLVHFWTYKNFTMDFGLYMVALFQQYESKEQKAFDAHPRMQDFLFRFIFHKLLFIESSDKFSFDLIKSKIEFVIHHITSTQINLNESFRESLNRLLCAFINKHEHTTHHTQASISTIIHFLITKIPTIINFSQGSSTTLILFIQAALPLETIKVMTTHKDFVPTKKVLTSEGLQTPSEYATVLGRGEDIVQALK